MIAERQRAIEEALRAADPHLFATWWPDGIPLKAPLARLGMPRHRLIVALDHVVGYTFDSFEVMIARTFADLIDIARPVGARVPRRTVCEDCGALRAADGTCDECDA